MLQRIREIRTTGSTEDANTYLNMGWILLLINYSGNTVEYILGRLSEPTPVTNH